MDVHIRTVHDKEHVRGKTAAFLYSESAKTRRRSSQGMNLRTMVEG
jgi:hypothetical protein